MPQFLPGSFTKNYAWRQETPGLSRLHRAIRLGFPEGIGVVTRADFRSRIQSINPGAQLVPVNFFLHNSIISGDNCVSADELVRIAVQEPHSRRFDLVALFALNLARVGKRKGINGDEHGAAFANHFARNHLWRNGAWQSEAISIDAIDRAFTQTIVAEGEDTAHKCATNYHFIFEACGLTGGKTALVNSTWEDWAGSALFLAFDRYALDNGFHSAAPKRRDLESAARRDELYKLLGVSEELFDRILPSFAQEYRDLNGLNRLDADLDVAGATTVGAGKTAGRGSGKTRSRTTRAFPVGWTEDLVGEFASVQRRLREVKAQLRNPRHVRELKGLYEHRCAFCQERTVVGISPEQYYSEAAHIVPLGEPHNGSDTKENMLVLCPRHHLQFDRGVLRIRVTRDGLVVASKIPGDPLIDRPVTLLKPHEISTENVRWHYNFWG